MDRKLVKGLVIALVAMFAISMQVMAAEKTATKKSQSQTLMGTITNLDAKKGTLTLKTAEGKTMPLRVAKKSLTGLQVGDHVKVEMTGKHVKAIAKEKVEENMGKQMEGKKS